METDIINPYSQADILKQPVSAQPFGREELITLLEEGVYQSFSPKGSGRYQLAWALTSIRMFNEFLRLNRNESANLSECVFEEFRSFFKEPSNQNSQKSYEQRTVNKAIDSLRSLINGYFFEKKYVRRKLLRRKPYEKYKPFLNLSEVTQKLILLYERDGRKVATKIVYYEDSVTKKEHQRFIVQRKSALLSARNREKNIRNVILILSVSSKRGVEDLTRDDLDRLVKIGRDKDIECAMTAYLASLQSMIANGIPLGILEKNPLNGFEFEQKQYAPRNDFIMPDQMEKILNIDTLNWNDAIEVRDRCITLTGYDTALRASSLTILDVKDFIELSNGEYQLKVRYVKGRRTDVDMDLLFDSTIQLLKYWINVARPKLKPKCGSLFVSSKGLSLTETGIRNSVQDCCRLLNVKTQKGLTPTPHTLRHSFATLNIEPYGKSLKTRQLQERLVHVSLDMVERVYIHNNLYAKMEEAKKLRQKDSRMGALGRISQEEFFAVLDSISFVKPSSVREIKEAYRRAVEDKRNGQKHGETMISEREALGKLRSFSVNNRSLRSWALKEGICHIEDHDNGNAYLYRKSVIENLAKAYVSLREARKGFQGSRPQFYRRIKGCQKVTIGKQTLILKDDLFEILMSKQGHLKNYVIQLKTA